MTHQNTSPLAPTSAYRAYQTIIEGAHAKPKPYILPNHISYYVNNALIVLLTKNPSVRMERTIQTEDK